MAGRDMAWLTRLMETSNIDTKNQSMANKIDTLCKRTRRFCNDECTKQAARNLVPIAELVQDNLEILEGDYQENLLPLLVNWFNTDFFRWFQPPPCETCSDQLEYSQSDVNAEGKLVEIYRCLHNGCTYTYQFIRHGDPAILLNTRQGRCGEWADCFFIFLLAMDYDARLVFDSTDHVWNEVWLDSRQQWIHVDTCENIVDTPLLYEVGWKKKMEYCLAYGRYEVIDVTSRYTLDFEETKTRRKSCDESWLSEYLEKSTQQLVKLASTERQVQVLDRRKKDLELLKELAASSRREEAKHLNLQARKTGSVEWRMQRGEYSTRMDRRFIIPLEPIESSEISGLLFSLTYDSDKNSYDSSMSSCQKKGWSTLIYYSENIDYKYERDWRTSYLARYEGCPSEEVGLLQWRFDVSNLTNWRELRILVKSEIYPSTDVEMKVRIIKDDDATELNVHKLQCNELNIVSRGQIDNQCKFLDLTVRLFGGLPEDSVAWQKPQLFRQTRGKSSDQQSFLFEIHK